MKETGPRKTDGSPNTAAPIVSFAPVVPMLVETPRLPRLSVMLGAIRSRRLKRNPTELSLGPQPFRHATMTRTRLVAGGDVDEQAVATLGDCIFRRWGRRRRR